MRRKAKVNVAASSAYVSCENHKHIRLSGATIKDHKEEILKKHFSVTYKPEKLKLTGKHSQLVYITSFSNHDPRR